MIIRISEPSYGRTAGGPIKHSVSKVNVATGPRFAEIVHGMARAAHCMPQTALMMWAWMQTPDGKRFANG
jgi:hypothetical protein